MEFIQSVLSTLKNFPEIWLAFLCFLSFRWYVKNMNQVVPHWPFVGGLPSLVWNANRMTEWVNDAFDSHGSGSISLTCPMFPKFNFVATCHPQNIEYILKTNFSNFNKGPEFIETFDMLGDGLLNAESSWSVQRKMAHVRFTSRDFRTFVANICCKVMEENLVPFLAQFARQGCEIDLQDIFNRFAYDITFCISFGRIPGYLQIGFPKNEFVDAVHVAEEAVLYRHAMPGVLWKLLRWLNVGRERKMANARKILDHYLGEYILLKKEELLKGGEAKDLMSTYIIPKEGEKSNLLAEGGGFLRDTALSFLLAGQEPTGMGFAWFFWLISKTPRVEAKIMEELTFIRSMKVKGDDKLSEKWPWVFQLEDLKGFVYLHAAICESLRLYPPTPYNHKGVVEDDVLPDGTIVKPGMKIILSFYSVGRMKWIWGEDCMEYKPERWIGDDGKIRNDLLSKFFVFNLGPRTCLGKEMVFTLMKLVAATIIFNFHVEEVKGCEVSIKPSIILKAKNGLIVKIKERWMPS